MSPSALVKWKQAYSLDGDRFSIPEGSLVTSRFDNSRPNQPRFALVCYSEVSLLPLRENLKIGVGQLRNLRTGRRIGASQVTSVVEMVDPISYDVGSYNVSILADLIEPYFVRLYDAESI